MKRTSLRTDGPRFLLWFMATTTQLLKIYGLKKKKISNRPESSHENPTVSDILYILPHACKEKKRKQKSNNKNSRKIRVDLVLHFSRL